MWRRPVGRMPLKTRVRFSGGVAADEDTPNEPPRDWIGYRRPDSSKTSRTAGIQMRREILRLRVPRESQRRRFEEERAGRCAQNDNEKHLSEGWADDSACFVLFDAKQRKKKADSSRQNAALGMTAS